MRKHKHLTLDDRIRIQQGLEARESFKSISRELGKDPTTISKEVKGHIQFKRSSCYGKPFNNCSLRRNCSYKNLCGKKKCNRVCSFAILLSVLVFAKTMFQRTAVASANHHMFVTAVRRE